MLAEIAHCLSHVILRLGFRIDHFVELEEIAEFTLIELEGRLLFKSCGESLDVSASVFKGFHLEYDRIVCEVRQFSDQKAAFFLYADVFEDLAENALLVRLGFFSLAQLLLLVLVTIQLGTGLETARSCRH